MKNFTAPLLLLLLFIASCRKEDEITNDTSVRLSFSEDTILFDTIFASIGSTTEYLLVFNNESKSVKISSIRLAKGNASYYRLNVDGTPGRIFSDVEIGPKDSLWIFIEVTLDPNNSITPFLVTDSIVFETNGNIQDVDLLAFGQNAHFYIPTHSFFGLPYSIIGGDNVPCGTVIEWDSILPHVVYGFAVVDSCITLKIREGTKIYFYQGSGLWVYINGTLQVLGTLDHPVLFRGTRLEPGYSEVPGQWDRIWIFEGDNTANNEINYAIIENGFIGIQPENFFLQYGSNPRKLILKNTIIRNMSGFGLLARDYTIDGFNVVIGNSGSYSAAFTIGGSYNFNHCTFANYWSGSQRSTPAVYFNNYYADNTGNNINELKKADFKNCIIYGITDNELQFDFLQGSNPVYNFSSCLLKVDNNTPVSDPGHFTDIIVNQNPKFTDTHSNNFELESESAAIDKGNPLLIVPETMKDLNGKDRTSSPDLGALER